MRVLRATFEAIKDDRPPADLVIFGFLPIEINKLLGVVIDNKLNWDEHLRQTITKVGRKIGALRFHRDF